MNLEEIINQKTITIVDVREPHEFELIRANGAINIPLGSISDRVKEFRKMSKPIVVYCASGNRSGQALNYLKSEGIEEVYNAGSVFQVLGIQTTEV